jgi:hypothetical protein
MKFFLGIALSMGWIDECEQHITNLALSIAFLATVNYKSLRLEKDYCQPIQACQDENSQGNCFG